MAYVKPGVKIIQEFRNLTPNINKPDLPAAIVGPCFQVVRKEKVLDEVPFSEVSDIIEVADTATINAHGEYVLTTNYVIGSRNVDVSYTYDNGGSPFTRRVGFDLSDSGVDMTDLTAPVAPGISDMTQPALFRELVRLNASKRFNVLPNAADPAAVAALTPTGMWDLCQEDAGSTWWTSYVSGLPADITAGDTMVGITYGYLFEELLIAGSEVTFVINKAQTNEEVFTISGTSNGPWGSGFNGHSFNTTAMANNHEAGESVEVYLTAGAAPLALTAQAAAAGGTTCSTASTGTLSNGDYVTITGTTSYNGTFKVSNVVANTSFDIPVTFVADDAAGSADILEQNKWIPVDVTSYMPAVPADRTITSDRIRLNFDVIAGDTIDYTVRGWPVTIPYPNPQNYISPVIDQSSVEFYMKDAWVEVVDVHTGAQSIETSYVVANVAVGSQTLQVKGAESFLDPGDTFQVGNEIYKARTIAGDNVTLDVVAHPAGLAGALSANDVVFNLPYHSGFRAGLRYFIDENVDFAAEGVIPGDKIVIDNNGGTYLVQEVEGNKITLTSEIYHTVISAQTTPSGSGDTDQYGYRIHRYYEEFKLPQGYEYGQDYIAQLNDVLLVAIEDEDGNPAISGILSISYRAFRVDAPQRREYETTDELKSVMEIDVWNPLGFGIYCSLINTLTPVTGVALTQDTELGYAEALELEENYADYAFVPLSQSTTVASMFYSHITQMSLPEHSKFRIGLYNTPLQTTRDVVEDYQGSLDGAPSEIIMSRYSFVLNDNEGDFFVNNIRPGQKITFNRNPLQQVTKDSIGTVVAGPSAYSTTGIFKVKKINTATKLEFGLFDAESGRELQIIFDDLAGQTTTLQLDVNTAPVLGIVDYTITRDLDKNEQAETIGSIAASYLNRRSYIIWPDKIEVSFNNEVTEQPGYYLACMIAGMIAHDRCRGASSFQYILQRNTAEQNGREGCLHCCPRCSRCSSLFKTSTVFRSEYIADS